MNWMVKMNNKEEKLNLKEEEHRYLKFNSYMHFIWMFGILYWAYYKYCPHNICSDDIMNVIVISFIPGCIYIVLTLMSMKIIYRDKDYKDKFNTWLLSKLKLYSVISIILSIILGITNYSIHYYYFIPSLLLEIINYLKLKKEYQQNNNIEEKIKNGSIDTYLEKNEEVNQKKIVKDNQK